MPVFPYIISYLSLQARVFNCLFQFTHLLKHTNILSNKDTNIAQLTFSPTTIKAIVSLMKTWSTYFSSGDHVTTLAPPSTWLIHGTLNDCCCPENWDTIIKSVSQCIYIHNTATSLTHGTKVWWGKLKKIKKCTTYTHTNMHTHCVCISVGCLCRQWSRNRSRG